MLSQSEISANLGAIKDRMAAAARSVERSPDDIKLVAVTKTFGPDAPRAALASGQFIFGENRVQEAEAKWPVIKQEHSGARLHLIGPLQRNKVRPATGLFDVIETLDRPKLAAALARVMDETGHRPDCLIQVNTGEEPQKAGVLPGDADRFVDQCRTEFGLPIVGLMCIPPVDEEASLHFALLREIAKRNGLTELSMGMSADFETAIRFGATMVRVGTAIFGPRDSYDPATG